MNILVDGGLDCQFSSGSCREDHSELRFCDGWDWNEYGKIVCRLVCRFNKILIGIQMNHRRPGRIQTPRTVTDEVMLASKSFLLTGKLVQKHTLVLYQMSLYPSNRLHQTLQFSVIRQLTAPISIIIGWTGHRVASSFNLVETFIRSNKIHDSRQIRGF